MPIFVLHLFENRLRAFQKKLMPCFDKISLLNLRHYTCTIVHYRHSIITWGALWALICYTLSEGPFPPFPLSQTSPCRTPRICSRPRASWGRCRRRARLLKSGNATQIQIIDQKHFHVEIRVENYWPTQPAASVKLLENWFEGSRIMKMAFTRENILVDLHGGCWEGSLSLVARTTVTL